MSTVGNRLKSARLARGLSQKQLARLVGVTSSYIVLLEAGKRKGVSRQMAERLSTVLALPREMFYEDAVMPELAYRPTEAIMAELQQSLQRIEVVDIPIRGAVPAGCPEAKEEEIEGYVNIPKSELGPAKSGLYALRVTGESLEGDGISDGDLLIVEPNPDIIDGKIYIVRLGNETVARHIYRQGSRYKLVSSNSKKLCSNQYVCSYL